MSRYDKYDPMTGGFRAPLLANFGYTASLPDRKHADLGKLLAVGINTAGKVLPLAAGAAAPFAGVLILTSPMAAGDMIDVMTDGEITDLVDAEVGGASLGAGLAIYSDPALATGVPTTTFAANGFYIGRMVESTRLIVRCMMRTV